MKQILLLCLLITLVLLPWMAYAEKSEPATKSSEFIPVLEEDQAAGGDEDWWDDSDEEGGIQEEGSVSDEH